MSKKDCPIIKPQADDKITREAFEQYSDEMFEKELAAFMLEHRKLAELWISTHPPEEKFPIERDLETGRLVWLSREERRNKKANTKKLITKLKKKVKAHKAIEKVKKK